ncbi:MAG: RNA 2',3'-cyclic phosphodiesterase [Chloroflexota bacterium]
MSDESWRCFVAVPVGDELRTDLRRATTGWRTVEGLRWTDPGGWHVTLAFIGSVPAASAHPLVERLVPVAEGHTAMSVRTGGLGAFPAPAHARVAWYGIHDEEHRLARLARDIAIALGIDGPQPFRSHVTLARARRPMDLRSWLASASAPEGVLEVDRIALMRSHLGGGPARYETLATASLGVPARV